jgi:hypothetical protein
VGGARYFYHSSKSEVGDDGTTAGSDGNEDYVRALEITMDDALFVCRLQRLGYLPHDFDDLYRRQRRFPNALKERFSFKKLHC